MRRQAQVFEGTTSKFASLFSVLYRQISAAQVLVSLVLVAAFLFQHAPARVTPWLGPQGVRFLQLIPYLDYQMWLLIGGIHIYFCVTAFRLGRMFAQKEVRSAMSDRFI